MPKRVHGIGPKSSEIFTNTIGMKMMLISPGEFLMGDVGDEEWGLSTFFHKKVRITEPFYLGIYQVTQREWTKVVGSNPSHFQGEDLPVENVSWEDCADFIKRLNLIESSENYRLPTEAEWEYACRAGSTRMYCFKDKTGRLGHYAWYAHNSGKQTHPVGEKRPNAWGLFDMHGNVWEWCRDWYDQKEVREMAERASGNKELLAKEGPVENPKGPKKGESRVSRGGSWIDGPGLCTAGIRSLGAPDSHGNNLGFRLTRSV